MDDRTAIERIGDGHPRPNVPVSRRYPVWRMITAIQLSGLLHFIVSFLFWNDIPGLLVASLTMFWLLLDSGVTTRAIVAYWAGYILGVMFHPQLASTTNTLMHFIVNLNATYGCPVAVLFAIAAAMSRRRSTATSV